MHELIKQLTFCNVPVFPCHDNKQPANQGGCKAASLTPGTYWPSNLFGITVPPNTFVIDIDAYKGMTTDKIEQMLGCKLDWDASLIQLTPSGGMHHAFQSSVENLRQGTDLFLSSIGKGFDTRAAGRGYICAGAGYTPQGELGTLALSMPDTLPMLPPEAVLALTAQDTPHHEPTPLPTGDRNADEINNMLRCIDADQGREDWMKVALALKHHYHDDDKTGFTLFDNWSMSSPDVYDPIESRKLWDTIAPTRADGQASVTLGTLVHKAIENGYAPGSSAADVFGGGPSQHSAPVVDIETLLATINERGGQPEAIDELTAAIRTLTCSDIQRAALTATLQRVLRVHDIKITDVQLRKACEPESITPFVFSQLPADVTHFQSLQVDPIQALGNVHIMNASMLRQALFTSRLARFGSEPHWWSGCSWEAVNKMDLIAKVAHAFIGNEYGKDSNINGTRNQLLNIMPSHKTLNPPTTKIYFKNGVLDPLNPSKGLVPHDPKNFNASTLTIEYGPHAPHPHWDKFLNDCFHVEPERITLLQEIMGWWLISDNLNHQKAVAFDGVSRSGKGTILAMADAILGDGMTDISIAQLCDNKSLSGLRAATLGVDRDAKRPPIRDAVTVHSNFNKITANEPISIPIIYSPDPWRGELNCKIAIACNGIPVMMDDSGASPSRWIVLKFTESMLGREDLGLGKRLLTEKSAIAAWAVNGLVRLISNGKFTMPESSIEESNALLESSSPMAQFSDECLDVSLEYTTHSSILWDAYKAWASSTNNKPPTQMHFIRGLERVLQSQGVHYKKQIREGHKVSSGLVGVQLKIHTAPNVTPINGTSTPASEAFKP